MKIKMKNRSKKMCITTTIILVIAFFGLFYLGKTYLATEGFSIGRQDDNTPRIVYYYMEGCGHCVKFMPDWDAFKSGYSGSLKVIKKEQGDAKSELKKYNVQGFPTVLFIDGTGKSTKFEGDRSKVGLMQFAKENEQTNTNTNNVVKFQDDVFSD